MHFSCSPPTRWHRRLLLAAPFSCHCCCSIACWLCRSSDKSGYILLLLSTLNKKAKNAACDFCTRVLFLFSISCCFCPWLLLLLTEIDHRSLTIINHHSLSDATQLACRQQLIRCLFLYVFVWKKEFSGGKPGQSSLDCPLCLCVSVCAHAHE